VTVIEGYDNRMLTAPRFVREGNRLIPQSALVRAKSVEPRDPEDQDGEPR
jgi:hypothetical protein